MLLTYCGCPEAEVEFSASATLPAAVYVWVWDPLPTFALELTVAATEVTLAT